VKKEKLFFRIFLIVIATTLYLNIGYEVDRVFTELTINKSTENILEDIAVGGFGIWNNNDSSTSNTSNLKNLNLDDHIIIVLLWPIIVGVSLIAWIIYGIIWVVEGIFLLLVFLWDFIFCGGLLNMIGAAWLIGMSIFFTILFFFIRKINSELKKEIKL